jgi:hypothetical protein
MTAGASEERGGNAKGRGRELTAETAGRAEAIQRLGRGWRWLRGGRRQLRSKEVAERARTHRDCNVLHG